MQTPLSSLFISGLSIACGAALAMALPSPSILSEPAVAQTAPPASCQRNRPAPEEEGTELPALGYGAHLEDEVDGRALDTASEGAEGSRPSGNAALPTVDALSESSQVVTNSAFANTTLPSLTVTVEPAPLNEASTPELLPPPLVENQQIEDAVRLCATKRCVLVLDDCDTPDVTLCGVENAIAHGALIGKIITAASNDELHPICAPADRAGEWATAVADGRLRIAGVNISVTYSSPRPSQDQVALSSGIPFDRDLVASLDTRLNFLLAYYFELSNGFTLLAPTTQLRNVERFTTAMKTFLTANVPLFYAAGNGGPDTVDAEHLANAGSSLFHVVGALFEDSYLQEKPFFSSQVGITDWEIGIQGLYRRAGGYALNATTNRTVATYNEIGTSAAAPAPEVNMAYNGRNAQGYSFQAVEECSELESCLYGLSPHKIPTVINGTTVRTQEQVKSIQLAMLHEEVLGCLKVHGSSGLYKVSELLALVGVDRTLERKWKTNFGEFVGLHVPKRPIIENSVTYAHYRLDPLQNKIRYAPGGLLQPGQVCSLQGTSYAAPVALVRKLMPAPQCRTSSPDAPTQ